MTDFDATLRDRFRQVDLPQAPSALTERVRSVSRRPIELRGSFFARRWRLFAPLAAILLIASAAVVGNIGRSPIRQPNGASQSPGVAALTISGRVNERCGPIGCAYHVELQGPGGPWRGALEYAELGSSATVAPGLPATISAGAYRLEASIHVISDATEPGEVEGHDLGTTATCVTEFAVASDTRSVAVSLGFWIDRCSAGATPQGVPALPSFELDSTIDGVCGTEGCEYRAVLSGPGGTWGTGLRSPNPTSQFVVGPDLPSHLTPGAYSLVASAHRMSPEVDPGAGHRQELSVAATCSTEFVVRAETRVAARLAFQAESCSVTSTASALPNASPEPQAETVVVCDDLAEGLEPALDCATAIDVTRAALGADRPPIAEIRFVHSCWSTGGDSTRGCAPQMTGVVAIRFVGHLDVERFGVSRVNGAWRAVEIQRGALAPEPDIVCTEMEPPAFTCEAIRDATLAALGPNHPPIDHIQVSNTCSGGQIPSCGRSNMVDVSFDEPRPFQLRMLVREGADGPIMTFAGSEPQASYEPSNGGPGQSLGRWFGPDYADEAPSSAGRWIWRAELSEDRRTLSVEFFGVDSASSNGVCSRDYEPWIGHDGDTLLVNIVEVYEPRQPAVHSPTPAVDGEFGGGIMVCIQDGYRRVHHLALPEPFMGDTVRDLNGWVVVLE